MDYLIQDTKEKESEMGSQPLTNLPETQVWDSLWMVMGANLSLEAKKLFHTFDEVYHSEKVLFARTSYQH